VIDYGEVTQNAALRKGAVIHTDYAGMLPAVILNVMLENLGAAIAAALEVCRDGHAESVRRWRVDADARVEGMLGVALGANRIAEAQVIGDGADAAAIMVRGALSASVLRQRETLDGIVAGMRRHTVLIIVAHGVLLVAAAVVLFI
jgi:hypothetical protein